MSDSLEVSIKTTTCKNNTTLFNHSMWRQMTIEDISTVSSIAMDIWAAYGETPVIYENKFRTYPTGCYVYDDNNVIKGYVISHPSNLLYPPQLNTSLALDEEVNCLFIHDIVVLPECRGKGIAHQIIHHILASNPVVSLVACDDENVQTKDYWLRYGFQVAETIDSNYGIYMVKKT